MELVSREYAVAVAKRMGTDPRKEKFSVIPNSINCWAADPFPIEVNGILYIFAEIFVYSKVKGCIGYTKLQDGKFTPWKIVIEEDYHMSFPYLFYDNDILYMCPETSASRQLYLYRCVKYPEKWEKDRVLARNVNYSDTVFYRGKSDIYGLTCEWHGIQDHRLKLFRVSGDGCQESTEGLNTLEYYLTRPAGKIFKKDDKDIAVSQICKPLYGTGMIFKECVIDWPIYEENELYRVFPQDISCDVKRKYVGTHTFNISENYMVVDLVWNRFSPVEKFFRFKKRIVNRR